MQSKQITARLGNKSSLDDSKRTYSADLETV